ncbi:cilia- and flagella-associated protein 61-like isoform X2 [Centruroides sculpturatus]|uniref:cilia- and flagella-associated protein 61-like isoform X2 n=1 Tax=Centruroides sculpturatus TaxID=218467 RepID=UPI000C6E5569|nr:cilia- and flagella-associated protein 61-like isoform X2 [Centruroides sculpturatus]
MIGFEEIMWSKRKDLSGIFQKLTGRPYVVDIPNRLPDFRIRSTEKDDFFCLQTMAEHLETACFPPPDFCYLMEMANLMYTVVGKNDEILGHATFMDFPEIYPKGVDESSWIQWLNSQVRDHSFKFINAIFLHYFVFVNPLLSVHYLKQILQYLFENEYHIQYCFVILLKTVKQDHLETVFKPITEVNKDKILYVAYRQNFQKLMHVRDGRIEDNDQLSPLLNQKNPLIAKTYGEFYFVELLKLVNENTFILVAEIEDSAVGLMILSAEVDVELLNKNFDLKSFHRLVKKTEMENERDEELRLETENIKNVDFEEELEYPKSHSPSVSTFEGFNSNLQKSNCFCIHFYYIKEEYKTRSIEFLFSAFEKYENIDHCIITVPHSLPEFPLLKHFVMLTPRPNSLFPHNLYLCHKASLYSHFQVRYAVPTDLPKITSLIKTLKGSKKIINDVIQYFDAGCDERRRKLHALVALNINQIIGIVVLRNKDELDTINLHYFLENFMQFEYHGDKDYGHVIHCLLVPMFRNFSRMFLKEILRITKKMTLHYTIYPTHTINTSLEYNALISPLEEFQPVKPKEFNYQSEEESQETPFALYHFSRKLSMKPKKNINHRIVIVGASEVALGVLEQLIFNTEMAFNNLVVISPYGISGNTTDDPYQTMLLPESVNYPQVMLDKLGFQTWTTVIYGMVTGIDCNDKYVTIESYGKYPYDVLVLCCGVQYVDPTFPADFFRMRDVAESWRREKMPNNVFLINDQFDASNFIYYVRNFLGEGKDKIVVYGRTLDAYRCVSTLLALGVSGLQVQLIRPVAESLENQKKYCIESERVDETIRRYLNEKHVVVCDDWTLKNWKCDERRHVTRLTFRDEQNTKHIVRCAMLVSYARSGVDPVTFKALSHSGLNFDGAAAVDATFRTGRPGILAGGTATRPDRRYSVPRWNRNHFDSRELGLGLGRAVVDAVKGEEIGKEDDDWPRFQRPVVARARLPGGRLYLSVRRPLHPRPSPSSDRPRVMETGSPERGEDYFRIELDSGYRVQAVVCLSEKEFKAADPRSLYGLHQSMLGNVWDRFREEYVSDFFCYFEEPWARPLFADWFGDFRREARKIVRSFLTSRPCELAEEAKRATEEEKRRLWRFLDEGCKSRVEELLFRFLSRHQREASSFSH